MFYLCVVPSLNKMTSYITSTFTVDNCTNVMPRHSGSSFSIHKVCIKNNGMTRMLNNNYICSLKELHLKQVCIPVGCVPPACWPHLGGGGRCRPPRKGGTPPPREAHPLRGTTPWSCDQWWMLGGGRSPVNRMTDRCKTLPSSNFVCGW